MYWLAGLLLGIYGHWSGDLTLRSLMGEGGGDLLSCLGWKPRRLSEEPLDAVLGFFRRREPGAMIQGEAAALCVRVREARAHGRGTQDGKDGGRPD